MTDIIPARDIDYGNVEEICGYQLLMCKIYECEGGLNLPAKSTPLTREVSRQAKGWLHEVKDIVASVLCGNSQCANLGDVPTLLQSYDLFHRIGNGIPCHDYLREVKLRTADRWLKGDKSISKTDVVLLLLSETDRNIRTLDERYAKYAISVMSSWIDELLEHGNFTDIPLAEAYRRLSYLLKTDLSVYMAKKEERQAKSHWISGHILTEEQIDALDTDTLWTYARFIGSIPFSSQREYDHSSSMYMRVLSKIASRPDTHPYTAQAIGLTFKRQAELIA